MVITDLLGLILVVVGDYTYSIWTLLTVYSIITSLWAIAAMLTLPKQDLSQIIAQASSLPERLQYSNIFRPIATDAETIDKRLENWCQVVAKGDSEKFQRRLAMPGWDRDALRSCLGEVVLEAGALEESEAAIKDALTSWGKTLQQLLQAAEQHATTHDYLAWQFSPEAEPQPFEAFYAPCLQLAVAKLAQTVDQDRWQYLHVKAQQALQAGLLERLFEICTWTLFHEFSQFRSSGNSMRDFFELQFQGRGHRDKYESFLQQLFQDGFYSFFTDYPVLARLIVTTIDFWVEMVAELIDRLVTDWSDLTQQLGESELRQVVDIKTSLSDPHNRGRTTLILTFDSGLKVVYKPKDLGTDVAFFQLLQWCNDRGIALPFQCLQVLNRGHYGWVEYVPAQTCEDEAAIGRFYQRSGMLLCLIHVLEGTDCHHENLIACGEQPILIDTETLLTPRMAPSSASGQSRTAPRNALSIVEQQLSESVIRTMLLPQWDMIKTEGQDLDLSGFGGGLEKQMIGMQWRDINTNAMQLEVMTVTMPAQGNAPTLRGAAIAPEDYLNDLVLGFEQMYGFLLDHRTAIGGTDEAIDSPLQKFAHQTLRFVFRATNTYAVILQQSCQPKFLKSGVDRFIHLDVLSRAFLTQAEQPNFWPMLAVETQAMAQHDIPFFTFDASSQAMAYATGVVTPDLWLKSGLAQVRQRIQQLSPADLQQQTNVIRGTFNARFLQAPVQPTPDAVQSCSAVIADEGVDVGEAAVQSAIAIATQLRQSAIVGEDGSLTWLGLGARSLRDGFNFGSVGEDLWGGGCGIALFLAALGETTGDAQWQALARQTLQPLRATLPLASTQNSLLKRWVQRQGMSGTAGMAGIVYGLSQIARLWRDEVLAQEAAQFARLIVPEDFNSPPGYEISRGVAGTILGLLALPQDDYAMKIAIAAGEYLLQSQQDWLNNDAGAFPVGFYDGIAGIAYALLRLFGVTQDERFRTAALAAIAVEQQLLSTQQLPVTWAEGMPGIGLARLGSLAIVDRPEFHQDIDQALKITQQSMIWGVDSVCWGNFGRLELFLMAAQCLERSDLQQMAEGMVHQLIQQVNQRGYWILMTDQSVDRAPTSQIPGLCTGLAGIGYQLLRLQNPQLSSILLWEAGRSRSS